MSNANTSSSEVAIRPGWDVGGSVFGTFDLLSALSRSLSQDNVHPEAVLAAEALGTGLIVAPERIRDAVDTLRKHEHYRLLQTRISIGLHYGNTQRAMLQSTPLLQFFAFTSAFKLAFLDEEIADILFEMLSLTGIIKKHPVSPMMFRLLLVQLSGHAESLAPVDVIHELASKVSHFHPRIEMYHRLDTQSLAKLFTTVFEALQDENVKSIRMLGSINGIWIAAALAWWLPQDYSLSVGDQILCGNPHGKVEIVLHPDQDQPWNLEIWTSLEHPSRILIDEASDFISSSKRLPLILMTEFHRTRHWKGSDQLIHTIKQAATRVASSLIATVLQYGTLAPKRSCCKPFATQRCAKVKISHIVNQSWLDNLETVLQTYGLGRYEPRSEITDPIEDFLKSERMVDRLADHYKRIQTICKSWIESVTEINDTKFKITAMAYEIAMDVILTCTMQPYSIQRYARGDMLNPDATSAGPLISNLLRGHMSVSDFGARAIQQLLYGTRLMTDGPPIIAATQDGIVISMAMLSSISSYKGDSLAIKYERGGIKKDSLQFSFVEDTPGDDEHKQSWSSMPKMNGNTLLTWILKNEPLKDTRGPVSFDLDTHVTSIGETLYLRQFLMIRTHRLDRKIKIRVSWLDAMEELAIACHIDINTDIEVPLDVSLAENLVLNSKFRWGQIYGRSNDEMESEGSYIVDTAGNELAKTFIAGRYGSHGNNYHKCHQIYVHHGGPLTNFVHESSKRQESVLII